MPEHRRLLRHLLPAGLLLMESVSLTRLVFGVQLNLIVFQLCGEQLSRASCWLLRLRRHSRDSYCTPNGLSTRQFRSSARADWYRSWL